MIVFLHGKVGSRCVTLVIRSEVSVKWTCALLADPNPESFSIYIDICMRAERTQPPLSPLRQDVGREMLKSHKDITVRVHVCVTEDGYGPRKSSTALDCVIF